MKLLDGLKYMGLCVLMYLTIALGEIFILKPLIDFVGNGFMNNFIVYSILMLAINPIAVYLLSNKLPFKPKQVEIHTPLDE